MVRGFAGRVKPGNGAAVHKGTVIGTLPFGDPRGYNFGSSRRGPGNSDLETDGLANEGQEAGMGCAALGKVEAGFVEAELAVDGQAHLGGVVILLAIVLPPADRAQAQGAGNFQGPVSAARAAKARLHPLHAHPHTLMDGRGAGGFTWKAAFSF